MLAAILMTLAAANVPRIDVAFALDTTGSMGDEIDVVKEKIVDIARNISAGQPRPDVRFGIVAYRDRGDAYLTKAFPFSREIADVQKALRTLDANGGGDEPEAVAEGLYAAVHELQWDFSKKTARMIFLIGDAGPHEYKDGKDWRKVTSEAAEKGITISVIGCSGLSPAGERVFEKIARMADGQMMHLTYTRVARANSLSANLLLSIHHDAVPDRFIERWEYNGKRQGFSDRFKGHSIFVSNDNIDPKDSLLFGSMLGQQLKARGLHYTPHYTESFMGRWRRVLLDADSGVYRYDTLVVLKDTQMPAVLLEAGSIVNRDEELALASPERQQLISAAVVDAVDSFCAAQSRKPTLQIARRPKSTHVPSANSRKRGRDRTANSGGVTPISRSLVDIH